MISQTERMSREKRYECKQCEKCFSQSGNLRRHERIHTGEKPFKCKQCEKCFSQAGNLRCHERTHTGEKPFKCKQCEKRFRYAGALRSHERIHSGEKPFKCKQCEKCFRQAGVLRRHERIHSREKPFKYKRCEKCFRHSGALRGHERLHTGERPFERGQSEKCPCTIQEEALNQKEDYICWLCQEELKSEELFSNHYQDHIALLPWPWSFIMYCFTFLELCLLITVVEVAVVFDYFLLKNVFPVLKILVNFLFWKKKKNFTGFCSFWVSGCSMIVFKRPQMQVLCCILDCDQNHEVSRTFMHRIKHAWNRDPLY